MGYFNLKWQVYSASASRWTYNAILIRARLVVQVHPGPPFKSPIYTRRFSLFPFSGPSLKKPFCQPFVNFTIGLYTSQDGVIRCHEPLFSLIRRRVSCGHCIVVHTP